VVGGGATRVRAKKRVLNLQPIPQTNPKKKQPKNKKKKNKKKKKKKTPKNPKKNKKEKKKKIHVFTVTEGGRAW